MIEQALYFGLGCAVAGLLALAFTPVLWSRALRLARKRLQIQIPVSMQEVWADRDHLRAGFAVERRTLEQEIERMRVAKATGMSSLGRRAAEIFTLTTQLTALRLHAEAQDAEIATHIRDKTGLETGLSATQIAMVQNHAYYEQRLERHEALRKAHLALEAKAGQQSATIGSLHVRVEGLELTIEDAVRARAALERKIEAVRQQAGLAGETRDFLASQLATVQAAHEVLRQRLHLEMTGVTRLEDAKRSLQSELDAALVKLRHSEAEAHAAARALENTKSRNAGRRVTSSGREPASEPGDALLRASIHSLGLAIAEMAGPMVRNDVPAEPPRLKQHS